MKSEFVFEGTHKYINYNADDVTIIPGVMTSCVLVIVFFENQKELFVYHWKGFLLDFGGAQAFNLRDNMCNSKGYVVSKILVLGNHFSDTAESDRRKENMRTIQHVFEGVEIHYYVNPPDIEHISFTIYKTGLHRDLDPMTEVDFNC